MAIAITLRGFNDLGRSVIPIFLRWVISLYQFSTFCEKMKKIYRVEVWIFGKTLHRIPFIWPLRLVSKCENDGNVWNYYNATDSPIQNIIWDSLPALLTYFLYLNLKALETMLYYTHQFIKIRLVFHTPYFYFISEASKSLSVRSRSLKIICRVENFRVNVLRHMWGMNLTYTYLKIIIELSIFFVNWIAKYWQNQKSTIALSMIDTVN